MNKNSLRTLIYLISTVAALCTALFGALVYAVGSGSVDKVEQAIAILNGETEPCPQVTAQPCPAVTAEPCPAVTCEPCPVVTPEVTEEPEPADTPEAVPEYIPSEDDYIEVIPDDQPLDSEFQPDDLVHPDVDQYEYQLLISAAAVSMEEMFSAAYADGVSLYLISGYRSYAEQVSLWHTYKGRYGYEYVQRIDASPDYTEHRLGLAADLGDADYPGTHLNTAFDVTPAYSWLEEHAWEYGWIFRYPDGKEDITGIMYSPWAMRYTGKNAAEKIHSSGMTLEEFTESLG